MVDTVEAVPDAPIIAPASTTGRTRGVLPVARYSPLQSDAALATGFAVLLLALWQGAVATKFIDGRLWPAPLTILVAIGEMARDGQLFPHVIATLGRTLAAFVAGSAAGIVLGLLMGTVRLLRALFDPIIAALSVLPKITLLPLVYLAFGGYGELPRIVTVALGVFAVMTITAMGAVRQIDGVLIEAGRNFGARRWQLFRHVLLPGSLPTIMSGLRVALATGLLVVIAAEFSYTQSGLGFLVWSGWNTLATTTMFVGLVCIALLGVLLTLALNLLERLLLPWKRG